MTRQHKNTPIHPSIQPASNNADRKEVAHGKKIVQKQRKSLEKVCACVCTLNKTAK